MCPECLVPLLQSIATATPVGALAVFGITSLVIRKTTAAKEPDGGEHDSPNDRIAR